MHRYPPVPGTRRRCKSGCLRPPLREPTSSLSAIGELLQGGHTSLILNMKHVPWLDTSGMTALVVAKKRAMKKGGDLRLLNLSSKVREELSVVRLLEVFDTFDNEARAVESF